MSGRLKPVREWRSVDIEYMQVPVRRGEWIQLVAYPDQYGDGNLSIIQLVVHHDGRIELTSDIPSSKWDASRTGPEGATP